MLGHHSGRAHTDTRTASEMAWWEIYFSPRVWKKSIRRAFLLALPITGPIYLISFVASALIVMPFLLIFLIGISIYEMWSKD